MSTDRDMSTPRIAPDHASHDLLLIAADVAADTSAVEAATAAALIATCDDCRALAADLAAITAASRHLPALERSRDFRLSPETAARLRDRSPLRRLMDGLTAPRGFGWPLAGTLMTLGLAGLLVSVLPGFPGGATTALHETSSGDQAVLTPSGNFSAGGSVAAPEVVQGGAGDSSAGTSGVSKSVPTAGPGGAAPAPADGAASAPPALVVSPPPVGPGTPAPAGRGPATEAAATPGAAAGQPQADSGAQAPGGAPAPPPDPSPLAVVSGMLLLAGVALLLVRRTVRQTGAGPKA